jgi:hypothetical protein
MTMQDPLLKRGTSDAASVFSVQAGREFEVEDIDPSNPRNHRTGHIIRLRLVKNSSGVALLPKYLVTFKAGTNRTEVDGYARTTAADGKSVVPVDEFLPSTGVPNGEYFWVVVHGPAMCYMPASEVADITEEDVLVALTAAASTHSTTAGRVAKQDLTGATAVLGNQVNGAFGRALSAKSSSSTNSNILVFVHNRWD